MHTISDSSGCRVVQIGESQKRCQCLWALLLLCHQYSAPRLEFCPGSFLPSSLCMNFPKSPSFRLLASAYLFTYQIFFDPCFCLRGTVHPTIFFCAGLIHCTIFTVLSRAWEKPVSTVFSLVFSPTGFRLTISSTRVPCLSWCIDWLFLPLGPNASARYFSCCRVWPLVPLAPTTLCGNYRAAVIGRAHHWDPLPLRSDLRAVLLGYAHLLLGCRPAACLTACYHCLTLPMVLTIFASFFTSQFFVAHFLFTTTSPCVLRA